jgi:hypothetical protein
MPWILIMTFNLEGEFLRNVYSAAGLAIKPSTSHTKLDMLKELMRAWGLEPGKILTREALAEPHRAYASTGDRKKEEIRLLGLALQDSIRNEESQILGLPEHGERAREDLPKSWFPNAKTNGQHWPESPPQDTVLLEYLSRNTGPARGVVPKSASLCWFPVSRLVVTAGYPTPKRVDFDSICPLRR